MDVVLQAAGLRMMWSMQSAAELNDRQKIQLHFHLQNSHHTPHSTLVQGEPLTPLNKRNRSLRYQEHSTNKISHTGTLFANDDAHIHVFFVTQNCTCNLLTERLARETISRDKWDSNINGRRVCNQIEYTLICMISAEKTSTEVDTRRDGVWQKEEKNRARDRGI